MNDEVDLRYWSLCKYRSIADGAADDCVYDEQAPLDAHNRYTIVVSTPEVRPANARPECGVAWMNWGVGDGIGNPHGGFLAFRHMLPSAGFKNSLWATHGLGDERRALGDYYPEATYEAKPAFEAGRVPARGVSPQPRRAEVRATQRATADSRVGTVSLRDCRPSSCM